MRPKYASLLQSVAVRSAAAHLLGRPAHIPLRMEEIIWTNCVKNYLLHGLTEDRNILRRVKLRKAKWIGHILSRNCVTDHVIGGKVKLM